MRKFSKFEKSFESKEYGSPSKAEGKVNGPLGTSDPTSHLTQRKLPGHINVEAASTIPHTRGCECYEHVEGHSSKKMEY